MTEPVIQFLGATGTVTGSRFLIETDRSRVLIDAGLFQGVKRDRLKNWQPFPVPPASLDAIAVTHAHIDHSGYLPALVRDGFAGAIVCTPRTAELCAVLLPDAAHLQEEEARYANRKGFSKHKPALPLYTAADAEAALGLLHPSAFGVRHELTADVAVTFQPAGHILGSSSVLVEAGSGPDASRILVSGDLGRGDHPLLQDPSPPAAAGTVLLESTYGDRLHPPPEHEIAALATLITDTAQRGGMVLVPAFAVDRTEVVLLMLRDLMSSGAIPRLPVYADSPMALKVLDIYRQAARDGDPDVGPTNHPTPFDPGGGLRECHTPDESRALASLAFPSIILSASGMATGGRVLHHLGRLLPDPKNAVVLSGFQAAGTRGRLLADGATAVKLLGRYVPVRADVLQMESLSVHADAAELSRWLGQMSPLPETVYLVHGEPEATAALAARLADEHGVLAVAPRPMERVTASAASH